MRKYSLILILTLCLLDKLKLSVLLITNKEDNNQVIKINFP